MVIERAPSPIAALGLAGWARCPAWSKGQPLPHGPIDFSTTRRTRKMNTTRRHVLKAAASAGLVGTAIAAGLLKPGLVLADWNSAGFAATKAADALAAIGATGATDSRDIQVKAPDIAENGAVVPVEVVTTLPDVESIALLGEKNANPLIALYTLTDFDGFLSTRMKMGQTANVRAVVKAGGKLYTAAKEVKVTVGGCGG
jgi:sulfur-oxidizing protein SoxY